jgi:glycosyltransferase involved in cell wall biosynthesis
MNSKKVIYINAPNIRHGGGLILLGMILNAAHSLEYSLKGNLNDSLKFHQNISEDILLGFEFSKSGILNYLFPYKKNKELINNIKQITLFFGNLPPVRKLKGTSLLYIHNKLLLEPVFKYNLTTKTRIRLIFEKLFILLFYKNVDAIIVQTPSMKDLSNKIFKKRETLVIPFFDLDASSKSHDIKERYNFFYPSYGYTYKNHRNLISAFNILAKKGIFPSIVMALDSKIDKELVEFIRYQIQENGIKIKLVLDRRFEDMAQYYYACSALVWPSLTDSFGIPLIEASGNEKDILASDLEYIHDILEIGKESCFDPYDPASIAECLDNYLSKDSQEGKNHKIKIKIFTSKEFINELSLLSLK